MKLPLHCWLVFGMLLAADCAMAQQTTRGKPRIEWDPTTMSLIQSNGHYARTIRLKNGQWLCGYDLRGRIWVRHSVEVSRNKMVLASPKFSVFGSTVPIREKCLATNWQDPIKVAETPRARLTNTELLQLRDGTLLCFFNERPYQRGANELAPPFVIRVARSGDNGQTWDESKTIYAAGSEFTNGCWEPAAIQLPSGEIQVFFANEGPYRESNEQEITLMRSTDKALSWSAPEKISFRPGHRDGMPVPLLLTGNRGIVVAVEDNGLSGNFKPVIFFSSLKENWHSGVREPGSTNRWSALQILPEPHVAASAPYLRQMPSGETLLSFQRSETGEMEDACMVVCIGDEQARNFNAPSRPFASAGGGQQLWNSLFVKDKKTVVAISEAYIKGVYGIWMVEGRFLR